MTLKDHKFSPAKPSAPAGKPIVIEVSSLKSKPGGCLGEARARALPCRLQVTNLVFERTLTSICRREISRR